jgi:hypothetical protein
VVKVVRAEAIDEVPVFVARRQATASIATAVGLLGEAVRRPALPNPQSAL